jgi:hypothetical protein
MRQRPDFWGKLARVEISVKTAGSHKANAMKKLDMQSRIDIVCFALLQGWLQDSIKLAHAQSPFLSTFFN